LRFFPATVELSNGATFVTSGRTAPGDGGGASFRYDASDSLSPDNGGTIRVDAGGRRWHAVNVNYFVSVRIFGAIADGRTDCAAAILAANAWVNPEGPSGCLLPRGNYLVAGRRGRISGPHQRRRAMIAAWRPRARR
jgi:hypothetical protein